MGRVVRRFRTLGTGHIPAHEFVVLGLLVGERERGVCGTGVAGGNVKLAGLGGEGAGGGVSGFPAGNEVVHRVFRAAGPDHHADAGVGLEIGDGIRIRASGHDVPGIAVVDLPAQDGGAGLEAGSQLDGGALLGRAVFVQSLGGEGHQTVGGGTVVGVHDAISHRKPGSGILKLHINGKVCVDVFQSQGGAGVVGAVGVLLRLRGLAVAGDLPGLHHKAFLGLSGEGDAAASDDLHRAGKRRAALVSRDAAAVGAGEPDGVALIGEFHRDVDITLEIRHNQAVTGEPDAAESGKRAFIDGLLRHRRTIDGPLGNGKTCGRSGNKGHRAAFGNGVAGGDLLSGGGAHIGLHTAVDAGRKCDGAQALGHGTGRDGEDALFKGGLVKAQEIRHRRGIRVRIDDGDVIPTTEGLLSRDTRKCKERFILIFEIIRIGNLFDVVAQIQ